MTGRNRRFQVGGALVLAGALCGAPAAAQTTAQVPTREVVDAGLYQPTALSQPTITLGDAVSLAIRQSPLLRRGAERVRSAEGRRRQSGGVFDFTLLAQPRLEVQYQQLTPFLRGREIGTRQAIQRVYEDYRDLTLVLRQLLEDDVPTIAPRCPEDLQFGLSSVDVERRDDTELAVLGVTDDLRSQVISDLTDTINAVDLGDICSTPVDPFFTPDAFGGALRSIDQSGGLGLAGVLTSISQIPHEIRLLQEEISHTVALRARLALDRLGPVPDDDLRRNFGLTVGASRLFRNGLSAGVSYEVQSQEHNFIDKPLDPSFGGLGIPPQFYSSVSGTFTLPLARGRGRTSVAAPEEASVQILAAEQDQFRHDISADVFRTVLAYLNLVAAQETERLLRESEARQQQIIDVTRQQVTGGTIPGFEVERAQARAAIVASQAAEARTAIGDARIALAEAMGVTVESIEGAPLAGEGFGGIQGELAGVPELLGAARESRRDLRAAGYRRTAAAILAEGARADARPRFDLSFTAGFSNLYESPFFRYLPDEREAIINQTATLPIAALTGAPVPPDSPVRYWSPRGFYRGISGRHEPFFSVNLTLELPFGNHTARGRSAQADAALRSAGIEVVDLARVIDENLVGLRETLGRTAAAVAASEEAVERGNELLTAVLQQLEGGNATVLDTLLTEEGVTADLLQLVRRRQAYLSALARLRFETGRLVAFDAVGTPDEVVRFDSGSFVGR